MLKIVSGDNIAGDKSNVRFKDAVETYKPQPGMPIKDLRSAQEEAELEEMTPEAREEIRRLAMSQQKSRLQEQRASHFAYDTFSLPASRVCIYDTICGDCTLLTILLSGSFERQ